MIYKLTSAKTIIAKVYRDLKPTIPGWEASALEWIGEAMEAMGVSAGTVTKSTGNEDEVNALEVSNYRVRIPCDLVSIDAVEFNGNKLNFGGDSTGYGLVSSKRTTNIYTNRGTSAYQEVIPGLSQSVAKVQVVNEPYPSSGYYLINPGYIITSFEEGHIKLHYKAYPTCDLGFPLIPDHYYFSTAFFWYVASKLLLLGYVHPTINYQDAEQRWFDYKVLAQNKAMFPSIDQMDKFRSMWVRLIPDVNLAANFFAGGETRESINGI